MFTTLATIGLIVQSYEAIKVASKQQDIDLSLSQLLPHADPMILLASILRWDEVSIECNAGSHLLAANPLRQSGILSVYAGVEYAAQAMAAHARLIALGVGQNVDLTPRKGFLAVASKLCAQVQNLDQIAAPLMIRVVQLVANNDSSLYSFSLSAESQLLLEGELMAVMAPL
jgi:predicted hotdog family 3-hydroxylacyl-ACP dehydratase